jgi:TolA-binding protein
MMNLHLTRLSKFVRLAVFLACASCLGLIFTESCAYFNKLYNAKKKFNEAKETPLPADGTISRAQAKRYDEVIEKCRDLLETYPKSRWVDDAILLIGKCYFEQQDYTKAIQTFEALSVDYPDSDLNEQAREYLARSYIANGEPERAIEILKPFLERYPKSDLIPVVLYLLGTTSLQIDQEAEAMDYLNRLAREHSGSPYKLEADLEMGEIFLEKEQYERSLAIYEQLNIAKLKPEDQTRCLTRLAKAYVRLNRFEDALKVFETIDTDKTLLQTDQDKATARLLRAETYVGLDSLQRAVDVYLSVGVSFPKSMFSAESYYRLGILEEEKLDSLVLAQKYFEKVPAEYANSPFSKEAVKRSSSIAQLLRLESSLGEARSESKAQTQFSLAEIQMLQFKNYNKALVQYTAVLDSFPDSEIAPKAAYAIGYIYQVYLADSLKAREAYRLLLERFPDSQQAAQARQFLGEDAEPAGGGAVKASDD